MLLRGSDGAAVLLSDPALAGCGSLRDALEFTSGERVLSAPFAGAALERAATLCELAAQSNGSALRTALEPYTTEDLLSVLAVGIFLDARWQEAVAQRIASLLDSFPTAASMRQAFGVTADLELEEVEDVKIEALWTPPDCAQEALAVGAQTAAMQCGGAWLGEDGVELVF